MNTITRKFVSMIALALFCAIVPAYAQEKGGQEKGIVKDAADSAEPKTFGQLLTETNLSFNFPEGFKEVKVPDTDALPFKYGMELPGQEFEIWLRVTTQKEGEKLLADKNIHIASTDSLFVSLAQDQIASFTTERNYMRRNLPNFILRRYNASAGSTYLLNIDDSRATKHYKYALLTVLQKNQAGVVLAICFTNEKGPDFFRTMNMAASCLRFKD